MQEKQQVFYDLEKRISDKNVMADQMRTHVTDMVMMAHAELNLLRLAVEAGDPKAEILVRIEDIHTNISKSWKVN